MSPDGTGRDDPTGSDLPDESRRPSADQPGPPAYRPLPPAQILPPPHGSPGTSTPRPGWGLPAQAYSPPPQAPYGPPTQAPYGPPLQPPPTQVPYAEYQRYNPPPATGYPAPQWGYGPWDTATHRRRRNPLAAVLLALVGIAAAGFFVLVWVSAATTGSGERANGAVTDETAVDHSPARAENPGTTPINSSDANGVVRRNTLYSQGGLDNGNCPAKPLGDASRQEQTVFYTALMNCLNDEWRPKVEAAGYSYTEPGLVVFDSPVDTPCGNASPEDGRTLAFYCPGDSVMYADVPQMRRFFDNIDVAYAIVIGHEFGHHVQEEVGVLQAYDDLTYDNFGGRLELNRRVELQASCMGGLFLGAVADSFPMDDKRLRQLQQVAGSFGDEPAGTGDSRDHGSGVSNREWIFTGYADNNTDVCNTFTAPAGSVD